MVTYQAWVSICFDTWYGEGGVLNDRQAVMSLAADVWQKNKDDLSLYRRERARNAAKRVQRQL